MLVAINSLFRIAAYSLLGYFYLELLPGWLGLVYVALAQSTISEHLHILREAGLIQGEIDGPRNRYCINQYGLASLVTGIASF